MRLSPERARILAEADAAYPLKSSLFTCLRWTARDVHTCERSRSSHDCVFQRISSSANNAIASYPVPVLSVRPFARPLLRVYTMRSSHEVTHRVNTQLLTSVLYLFESQQWQAPRKIQRSFWTYCRDVSSVQFSNFYSGLSDAAMELLSKQLWGQKVKGKGQVPVIFAAC